MMIRILLWYLCLGFLPLAAAAQDSLSRVIHIRQDQEGLFREAQLRRFPTLTEAQNYIQQQVIFLHKKGHLEAAIDQWTDQGDTLQVWVHGGPVYTIGQISLDAIPKAMLNGAGIVAKDYHHKVLNATRIGGLMERLLVYAENNGYPFARTYLDSLRLDSSRVLHAALKIDRGPYVQIDSLRVFGDAQIDHQFLQSYLGIKEGRPYNEQSVRAISKRIQELPFLQEARPWVMNFTIDRNNLDLYLNEQKANQVNALIGLQPNTQETKKFLWTADILLLLHNTLGYGESFHITYKNLQARSPQLNTELIVPYLLGSNLALDGKFEFFGRDTLFRRTSFEIGVRYMFNARDYFRLAFQQFNNRTINPDTAYVRRNKTLNDNVDLNTRGLSADYVMNRTDHYRNPTRGWAAKVSLSGLQRSVLPNDAILSIADGYDYTRLYDTANKDNRQYKAQASLQYYVPLARLLTLKAGYEGAYISGQHLYQNELYQIGGFQILRGFDERSIYTNQYHVFTAELRTLLGPESYFFIFADGGLTYTRYNTTSQQHSPLSFGTGITLNSPSGMFNVVLALGRQDQESFQFRNTRIHFGYVTYF